MKRSWFALVGLVCALSVSKADNWPGWRGPEGNGHSREKMAPLRWSKTENIRWKLPLPGPGNSSPIVWGDRIFLTQSLDRAGTQRAVLCIDRTRGKKLWEKAIPFKGKESTHKTNPYCSATPVTDGQLVIASLGSAGVVCYDFEGNQLWHKDLGTFEHIWGNASSPILYKELVLLWCGPGERQFLIALNKKTGEKVWEHKIPGGASGKKRPWVGSWSTPVIVPRPGKVGNEASDSQLVLSVPEHLKGFDPGTGKELWSAPGLGKLVYTSPVCSSQEGGPKGKEAKSSSMVVVALSGYHGPGLAVEVKGGKMLTVERLWGHTRPPQRIGSPVILGKHAYLINEPGQGSCLDLRTGKDLWKRSRVTGKTWGSLIHVAGRLYVTSVAGETIVLNPNPSKPEVLARNRINETVRASLAVSDGELFLRSYEHLWCISTMK